MEQLYGLAHLVEQLFASAGVEYRIVGGFATYLYVEEKEPDAGRLTRDIDIAVRRADLEKIAAVAPAFGLEYRHVAGIDMLARADQPSARRAVHMVFTGEKVRQQYVEPTPELGACRTIKGVRLLALSDLVRMKLISFRLKDQTHLKDMDEAGLITVDIEAGLSPELSLRLAQIRSRD